MTIIHSKLSPHRSNNVAAQGKRAAAPLCDFYDDAMVATLPDLCPPGSRVVVATSGGPDSQVLLHVLAASRSALKIGKLWAVGVDHGLRAAASDELLHAARLATQLDVPFTTVKVRVPARGNLLANARQARYQALYRFARRHDATAVAVAHTATDQLETVLLHLCRGATLRGAGGMRPRRGLLVRPLLHVARPQILAYAAAHHLGYAEDPSNADPRRARSRLRARVTPGLESINPAVAHHVANFAEYAQEDEALLMHIARRRLGRILESTGQAAVSAYASDNILSTNHRNIEPGLLVAPPHQADAASRRALTREAVPRPGTMPSTRRVIFTGPRWLPTEPLLAVAPPIGRRMLRAWLESLDTSACLLSCGAVTDMWRLLQARGTAAQGSWVHRGTTLYLERGKLWAIRHNSSWSAGERWSPIGLAIPGSTVVPVFKARVVTTLSAHNPRNGAHLTLNEAESVAFDADRLHFGLELRPWRRGDKMRPFGLKGHMKVGDLFTNAKVPRLLRANWPIVAHGNDVAWVLGIRRGSPAPLTHQTHRVITLKLDGALLGSAC